MPEYIAMKDFKFKPNFKAETLLIKKGSKIMIENNRDFPDVEDKMMHFNYVRKPNQKEETIGE